MRNESIQEIMSWFCPIRGGGFYTVCMEIMLMPIPERDEPQPISGEIDTNE